MKYNAKSWHQVIDKVLGNGDTAIIKIPISAITIAKEIINAEELISKETVEVQIEEIEEALIRRVIVDKELQEELVSIARRTKHLDELNIYTDGSITVIADGREGKRMGLGWVIVDRYNSENSISFNCRITDWPSSTRAELGAIWTVLLVVPHRAKVRIHTDSKAAIEGIENFLSLTSIRKAFKTKNRCLVSQIKDCCETKAIELRLVKVKGHSTDIWNNVADDFAKRRLLSNKVLKVQNITTSNIRITPLWKGNIIDNPLRTFTNITTATVYETAWANLSSIKVLLGREIGQDKNDQIN